MSTVLVRSLASRLAGWQIVSVVHRFMPHHSKQKKRIDIRGHSQQLNLIIGVY
jgi:hypothetical protein